MRRYEYLIREPQLIGAMLDMFDIAFLGMFDEEYPYVVPLNFGYDIKEGKLYIYVHCALTGHKLDLLEKNPNVCVTFAEFQNHPNIQYKGRIHNHRSVMAFGKMSLIPKPDKRWFPAAHRMLDQYNRKHDHYWPERIGIMDMYVIECDWDNVYGKTESPVRTVEDVPFVDVENVPIDKVPYDVSDLLVKKVDDPWERRKVKEIVDFEKMKEIVTCQKARKSLLKDQKIKIGAKSILMNLFWEKAPTSNEELECDLIAFFLQKEDVLKERWDIVFYNQPIHDSGYWKSGHAVHWGEGKVSGDEKLLLYLSEVKPKYKSIVMLFSIYDAKNRNQNLSMLKNVKLVASDADSGEELFTVNVSERDTDKASVFIGEFSRSENEWEFHVSNRADPENNVAMLSTQFGIRHDWRHING
jgi:Uncharacterized proteins involved in stress response, homologs of TerZ and putative cAMP-binding protein CABP1